MSDAQITMRVDSSLKSKVQVIVDKGTYRSISHFIEEAIREKLDRENNSIETTESLKQHILKLESRIEQLERAVQVGVLMYDNKEMIEKERKKRVNE